jgi:hypothetical protein
MDVEFKPGSTSIVYAINDQGVFYKSTDGGLTWAIKPTNYSLTTGKDGFNWRFCRKSKSSSHCFFDRRKPN